MGVRLVTTVAVVAVLLTGACRTRAERSQGPGVDSPVPNGEVRSEAVAEPPAPLVYVAVGASETVGIGADRPTEEAWPLVLSRIALPADTVFVNLGIPGATVADALVQEVPQAVAREPELVTVWLNVNDLIRGVTPDAHERELGRLVRALRRGGETKVLVANMPPLDRLPVFVACRPGAVVGGRSCPTAEEVRAVVDAYNRATGRVVEREGAVLVDLHAAALDARRIGTEAAMVSADGFHPSTFGHRAVAQAFASALERSGGVPGRR